MWRKEVNKEELYNLKAKHSLYRPDQCVFCLEWKGKEKGFVNVQYPCDVAKLIDAYENGELK
jgi:hypothetical protein